MSDITETKAPSTRRSSAGIWAVTRAGSWRAETWAVVLSVAFIALIVAGVFPRVPW